MVLDKFRAPRRFEPILEIIYLEMSWQLSSTQLIENHRIDTSILVARNRYLIADRLRFSLVLVIRLSLTNVSTSIRNPFVPRVIANSPGNRFVTRSRNFHITIAVSNPMRECAVKNSHRFRILSKDTNTVKERRLWCRRNNNTNYRQLALHWQIESFTRSSEISLVDFFKFIIIFPKTNLLSVRPKNLSQNIAEISSSIAKVSSHFANVE